MATLLDELSQLISALDENDIEYAVCAGPTLTTHEFSRATFGIDILICAESLEKAYEVTAKFGAFQKLTMTAKLCRSIFCSLPSTSKMFGKLEKS